MNQYESLLFEVLQRIEGIDADPSEPGYEKVRKVYEELQHSLEQAISHARQ